MGSAYVSNTEIKARANAPIVVRYTTSKANDGELPDFLFRAHISATRVPVLRAETEYSFDSEFKSIVSLQMFSKELEDHLGKTERPTETFLMSSSPILQWTIHTVGQKHRRIDDSGVEAGLAIFDVRKWQQSQETALFRVRDLCDYFASKGLPVENEKWKRYATNCDEYVAIGEVPNHCLVRWVTWSEMNATGFLTYNFYWSYTLDVVQRWNNPADEDEETLYHKASLLVRLIAGTDQRLRHSIINCIFEADFRSWGRRPVVNTVAIKKRLLDADKMETCSRGLAALSIVA